MKQKLKDIRKGDFVLMYRRDSVTKEIKGTMPFKVTYIEFINSNAHFDLVDSLGNKKSYGFIDWNTEMTTAEQFELDICPTCGQEIPQRETNQ